MARVSRSSWFATIAIAATSALASVAGVASAAPAAIPAEACTAQPYAYAGLVSNKSAQGIQATVTILASADVPYGHVAGWIGVGGVNAGPGGQAEWLQTGVNTSAGSGSELYVEITQPGVPIRYLTLASGIQAGSSYHLSVVQLAGKRNQWQVLVNGLPRTDPISLPGSGRFRPMAMSESWNGGSPACNAYAYRFGRVRITTNGAWQALTDTSTLSDLGYKVINRTNAGFTALSA